jgi:hypothetical protein
MFLLNKVFVEVVSTYLVLKIVGKDQVVEITIKLSYLFFVFLGRFSSHFDDLSNSVDIVPKRQAAEYFQERNNESFDIIGRNDLSEPNRRENGGSPVPSNDILVKIAAKVNVGVIQPNNRNVKQPLYSGH